MSNKILTLIILLIAASSCNVYKDDPEQEDYELLFPFTGIDKPSISYEDMIHEQCNIDKYVYPGVNIISNVREYNVVLTCKYKKSELNSNIPNFFVKYVDKDKTLKILGSNADDTGLTAILDNNVERTVKIKLQSGYPMYLSVNGKGDRETRIEASIKAISTDGVVIVPELKYAITQTKIGMHDIVPFCQYIVLP